MLQIVIQPIIMFLVDDVHYNLKERRNCNLLKLLANYSWIIITLEVKIKEHLTTQFL